MAAPERTAQQGTFFVTFVCANRRRVFQKEANAQVLFDHLQEHRRTAYLLHAFVIMPDHLHALLTPLVTLERAVQMIKGGFSRKYHVTGNTLPPWQRGFTDHRVRDREDFLKRRRYLENNPVASRLSSSIEEYRWSSAYQRPQRLKPNA